MMGLKEKISRYKDRLEEKRTTRDMAEYQKEKTKSLERKLDAANAKQYLDQRKEVNAQKKLIKDAKQERFNNSFSGKLLSGTKSTFNTLNTLNNKRVSSGQGSTKKRKFASRSTPRTGTVDSSILFNNMRR